MSGANTPNVGRSLSWSQRHATTLHARAAAASIGERNGSSPIYPLAAEGSADGAGQSLARARRRSKPSSGREPHNQQHQEDHDKDEEQDAGDVGARGGDAAKAKNGRHDRDKEKYQRPFQQ